MRFKAEIDIMPLEEILDPQGKVVNRSLNDLGISGIENVRIGKHIHFFIDAENKDEAEKSVEEACKKLLANLIVEQYTYSLSEA